MGSLEISIGSNRILFILMRMHLFKRNSDFCRRVESIRDEEGDKVSFKSSVEGSLCFAFLEDFYCISKIKKTHH